MKLSPIVLRRTATAAALVAGLAANGLAQAENHGLILWIGDYGSPRLNLPGIDLDAQNARKIAMAMGVPSGNIKEVANVQLTRATVASELNGLASRIQNGDKVFVYYSGHGHQVKGIGGARCTEALVTRGPDLYADFEMQDALTRLGAKASQVVMMNDSCFSGGAATKDLQTRDQDGAVAKFYPEEVKGNSTVTDTYQCGEATNKMTRNLEAVAARTNVLYVAASTDTQVSFATPRGSVATLAWATCLTSAGADANRSGSINGKELRACAQRYIDSNFRFRQTIMLQGDEDLPLSFASSGGGSAPVNAARALADIRAGASKDFKVSLQPSSNNMRIKQDYFDFQVSTNRSGYLYILQVGSDGKTFNLLFPNKLDQNNQIAAGNHQFPKPSWRVRSGGPAGTSHLLAVVTQTPKEMTKDMDLSATFASAQATESNFKTLFAEASGATGGAGGYGASAVVQINETP
jgi:hypothetical protein